MDWGILVAGFAAGFAGLTAWNSYRSANASRQSAAASRDALERAHRPVLVPVSREIDVQRRTVRVQVRNVGMGPALNASGTIAATVAGDAWGVGRSRGAHQIAAADVVLVAFEATHGHLDVAQWHVRFTYEDAAGEPHWSAFHFARREEPSVAVGRGALPAPYTLPDRSSWQEPVEPEGEP